MISRILFQISSDKHQRSCSRRVGFQNCYSLLVSGKVRLWLLTFRVHIHLNSKLCLSCSWFVNLKNIWIGVHTSWCGGVGARNGCLEIAFKLSTFTSSFLGIRTRNVYRYKTFELFRACGDFRTFLFENVWVIEPSKVILNGRPLSNKLPNCRGYRSGSNVTSFPVGNVLFLGTVQSSSFEIASTKFDLSSPKLPCIRRDLDECLISRIKPVCL